jgi:hypothetical protein
MKLTTIVAASILAIIFWGTFSYGIYALLYWE